MVIKYKSKKIEKVCTSAYEAQKKYGADMAAVIQQRVAEIESSEAVECMVRHRIGRCHPLKGNREGQYALDLVQPHRLIFSVEENSVEIARIEEIVIDYH